MATVSVDDVSLPAAPDPEPSIDDDALEWLYHCLTKLPPRERQAVDLRFFRDASQEEIARVLGVTTGNARRIVFNGVVRLRQCIQRARVENEEG
jgi:RNA polymerase sigma factor (sigma-70 family)